MRRPNRTSLRTSLNEAFIRKAKSFYWTSPTLTYPLLFTVGVGSHCDVRVTCPSMLVQEFYSNMHGFDYSVPFFVIRIRGIRIVVTPDIVFEVLRVPRVEHLDDLGCERLRTVSKDELISFFCDCPSDWGDCQFTSCMTFVLHPLSHYNSITEPVLDFCFLF